MKKIVKIMASFFIAGAAFSSCTVKDDLTNTGSGTGGASGGGGGTTGNPVQIRLGANNPSINYTRATVQIQSVSVNATDDGNSGWVALSTNAGMYDLMQYLNSTLLLASGRVQANTVKQIKIV